MRNYEYISTRKIAIYYPQAVGDQVTKSSTKIGFSAKIASAEFAEEKARVDSDHHKIETIVAHLDSMGQLGDLGSEKPWLTCQVNARAITTGRALLFVSKKDMNEGPVYLILLASMEHLIGADYAKWNSSELSYYEKQQPVGHLGIEYFERNSNTLSYAWALRDAYTAEDLANRIDFKFESKIELLTASYQLNDNELAALNEKAEFNETMIKIWGGELHSFILNWPSPPEPNRSFRQRLVNIFRVPFVRWRLGQKLYRSKMEAVKKNYWLERMNNEKLSADEKTLLEGAFVVARSRLEGRDRQYETVTRVLLTGVTELNEESEGRVAKVILASPLYLAST